MKFVLFCGGLVAIMLCDIALFLLGHEDAAWVVGYVGTVWYMALVLAWVAIYDSRERWPNTTAWQRAVNIIGFKR